MICRPPAATPPRLPPLNGLEAFEAVARHGSFAKAADALSITPSAVSHRIAQLEWLLGVPLFVRLGHAAPEPQPPRIECSRDRQDLSSYLVIVTLGFAFVPGRWLAESACFRSLPNTVWAA